jgi:ankyrin repeat protein
MQGQGKNAGVRYAAVLTLEYCSQTLRSQSGYTALMRASMKGRTAIVRMLVCNGADFNKKATVSRMHHNCI